MPYLQSSGIEMEPHEHSVLVVDDAECNRLLYGSVLQRAGYSVQLASSGAEALDQIAAGKPSLVLLDYVMPGMNGSEVIRRLRQQEQTQDLPVIVLTASMSGDDIETALGVGADDYINKPVDSRILVTRIRSIIRARQDRVRAAAANERDALRRELEEAQAVQRAQLPDVPVTWTHWHAVGTVVPSGQIAGDVFDLITTEDGRFVALVVDVSGHGTGAALVAAETRTGLRELVSTHPLLESLTLLNLRLNQRDTGHYACVAAVELKGDEATVVNAGLPPVLLLRNGRSIGHVVASGFPVGLFPQAQYFASSWRTEPSDVIVLVSDGVTEPFGRSDDVETALDRIAFEELIPLRNRSASDFDERIHKANRAHAPHHSDDATLLLLEHL